MNRTIVHITGFAALAALCALTTDAEDMQALSYEAFGAVGDGKADDRPAIIATHAAANKRGVPVRAKDDATYYMGCGGGTAIVRTDVDFGSAKFIIDDSHVEKRHIRTPAFSIVPDDRPFAVTGVTKVAKGQARLNVSLPARCLVALKDNGTMRFIRYGRNQNNGGPQQEVVLVERDGQICPETPVVWDYERVTSATAHPIGARTLVMKGGTFTTIANQAESKYTYYARGIDVRRSNVRIEGFRHLVTGELDHGAPYSGFLSIDTCADVTVTGCVFTARRTYETIGSAGQPVNMGSYGISVTRAANVRFLECRQTTDILDRRYWGLFGSNLCRNLLFDGCEFSRFDAHTGVANATIRNSTLGYMGIQAIGFGTLLIENCTVRSNGAFISLRSDYGSSWDGDIVIRNSKFIPCNKPSAALPPILNGYNAPLHDFGYACTMPRRLTIDGLFIDDTKRSGAQGEAYVFGPFNRTCTGKPLHPYPITEELVLRNVRTASGRPVKISSNKALFDSVRVVRE